MSDPNGSPSAEVYRTTERVDRIHERVANIEGRLDYLATKTDVANAKVAMILSAISIVCTLALVFSRFLPVPAS